MKPYYKREFTWRRGVAWAIQGLFVLALVVLLVAIMGPLAAFGGICAAAAIMVLLNWAIKNS
jgi:hypothetical protein